MTRVPAGRSGCCLHAAPLRWRWRGGGVALALLVTVLLAPLCPLAEENALPVPALLDQRKQVQQLSQEQAEVQQQLARFQGSEKELRLEVEMLSDLVRISLGRKQALEERIAAQSAVVDQQRRELARLGARIRDGKRRIGQRLHRIYRMSKYGRSAALFQIARFQSFVKNSQYLALLQQADREAIRQYQALNRELIGKQEEVERTLEHLISLREDFDEESRLLREREAYLKTSLQDVGKNRVLYRRYLNDLKKMVEGMEAAIVELEKEASTARPQPSLQSPVALRGSLPPPVEGEIVAEFGRQDPRYDLKKFQRGIVLRVVKNAPVRAVAGGRAVHAGIFRGYQALVVLDHGQGLFTVYGHLQDLTVKRGQWVRQGASLGRATYQPVDQAYNVYFEVRHNGIPDDPLSWIQPGRLRNAPHLTESEAAGGRS